MIRLPNTPLVGTRTFIKSRHFCKAATHRFALCIFRGRVWVLYFRLPASQFHPIWKANCEMQLAATFLGTAWPLGVRRTIHRLSAVASSFFSEWTIFAKFGIRKREISRRNARHRRTRHICRVSREETAVPAAVGVTHQMHRSSWVPPPRRHQRRPAAARRRTWNMPHPETRDTQKQATLSNTLITATASRLFPTPPFLQQD